MVATDLLFDDDVTQQEFEDYIRAMPLRAGLESFEMWPAAADMQLAGVPLEHIMQNLLDVCLERVKEESKGAV